MAALNKLADRRAEQIKQEAEQKVESGGEWDDFLTPQDEWKKKNTYDE